VQRLESSARLNAKGPINGRASASFDRRGTLTLTNLITGYATLAYVMNAYELEAPKHATEKPLLSSEEVKR